jgi:3-oxoisoapionate decarboxylase
MRLGISSYTYTWAIGVPGSMPGKPMKAYDLIDKAFTGDLNLVQIADNLPLEKMTQSELQSLRQYASGKGVSIEMGGRGLTAVHTLKCLETAVTLGSPILRMVIDDQNFKPDLQSIISTLNDFVSELNSKKIKLAIENHDRLKAREFERIINGVGSDMVGICLDSVNSMGAGEGFETVSDILLPYTINLHVKDFTIARASHKMGLVIEGRPAGKGMLNIQDLLFKASQNGLCQSAVLELWTPPEQEIEATIIKEGKWASESIEYMKQVMK